MTKLHALDKETWLEIIWDALWCYHEDCISRAKPPYDKEWDDICSAMAYIREDLELPDEIE